MSNARKDETAKASKANIEHLQSLIAIRQTVAPEEPEKGDGH